MRRRLANAEGIIGRDRGLLFLDAADIAPAGTAVEHAGEFREFGGRTDSVDFDTAIVEITGVAGESELDGGALCEVALADALNTPAYIPAACFGRVRGGFAHRGTC